MAYVWFNIAHRNGNKYAASDRKKMCAKLDSTERKLGHEMDKAIARALQSAR